ncbi:MAG: hypothetical protein ACRCYQ_13965, partial [Nocardioides sp.]
MRISPNTVRFDVRLPSDLLPDSDYYQDDGRVAVLANAVSGSMDVVRRQETAALKAIETGTTGDLDGGVVRVLAARGYVHEGSPHEEQARYQDVVDGYFRAIRDAPFQFMFIPSFVCNLACSYCFEGELTKKSPQMD